MHFSTLLLGLFSTALASITIRSTPAQVDYDPAIRPRPFTEPTVSTTAAVPSLARRWLQVRPDVTPLPGPHAVRAASWALPLQDIPTTIGQRRYLDAAWTETRAVREQNAALHARVNGKQRGKMSRRQLRQHRRHEQELLTAEISARENAKALPSRYLAARDWQRTSEGG